MGLDYHVDSWLDRYEDKLVREGDKDEQVFDSEGLTEMVSVEVIPPWGREDPDCKIHGQISVKVGQSDVPVILFSRGPDDPAHLLLSLIRSPRRRSNLLILPDLPDGASPPPPLEAIIGSTTLRLTMKLYERTSSGGDELIADVTDFEHYTGLQEYSMGRCLGFTVPHCVYEPQLNEFSFGVGYVIMWGARAEIEVKVNPQMKEGEEGGAPISKKPKSSVPVNAEIEAIHNMTSCSGSISQSVRTLYNKSEVVIAGDKLKLQRSVVCLPMDNEQFLTILVRPDRDVKDKCILLDFPFERVRPRSFRTNKQLTHIKEVPGTPFSVSIKILNPREHLPQHIQHLPQHIEDRFKCPISSWLDGEDLVNLFRED